MSQKTESPLSDKNQTAINQASLTPENQAEQTTTASGIPDKATKVDKATKTEKTTADNNNGLPIELLELVDELRDMVKGINPKKHTVKTLRRLLSNVGDILADIERLYDRLNHKS